MTATLASASIWDGVDLLLDRARDLRDLQAHRLELLAGRRLRARGLPVPEEIRRLELQSALATMTVPTLLQRVRDSCDGSLLLFKGPEISRRYPDPALRGFKDVDLLAEDADATQRALLSAGFVEEGDPSLYVDIHHLRPLRWPTFPLLVEIHERPKWPDGLDAPQSDEFFSVAVPCALPVAGVVALPPAYHALVLAAHGWAHAPLGRLGDLVDVAAAKDGLDCADLDALAGRLGIQRVWRATAAAVDCLLDGGSTPAALRLWARHLVRVGERRVLENHLEQSLSPFWSLPPRRALGAAARATLGQLRPAAGESWPAKTVRVGKAAAGAFERVSVHDRGLAANGERPGRGDDLDRP